MARWIVVVSVTALVIALACILSSPPRPVVRYLHSITALGCARSLCSMALRGWPPVLAADCSGLFRSRRVRQLAGRWGAGQEGLLLQRDSGRRPDAVSTFLRGDPEQRVALHAPGA